MSKLTECFVLDKIDQYKSIEKIGNFKDLLKFLDIKYHVKTTQQYFLLTSNRVGFLQINGIYYEKLT